MTVDFELDGQRFTALNGGPVFRFNEAISFRVTCANQDEVDYYRGLSASRIAAPPDRRLSSAGARRATKALLQVKELGGNELRRACEGEL